MCLSTFAALKQIESSWVLCTTLSEIALYTLRVYVHHKRKLGGPPATYKLHYID
jgi:hypothetical protein